MCEGEKISFTNNPIGQSEEWETEICCEKCGTHYSVIGSAYFCPCCGYNSAVSAYYDSLDSIGKMLDTLPEMRELLIEKYDKIEYLDDHLFLLQIGNNKGICKEGNIIIPIKYEEIKRNRYFTEIQDKHARSHKESLQNQVLRNRKTMPVISQWARESKLLPALIPKMDSSE